MLQRRFGFPHQRYARGRATRRRDAKTLLHVCPRWQRQRRDGRQRHFGRRDADSSREACACPDGHAASGLGSISAARRGRRQSNAISVSSLIRGPPVRRAGGGTSTLAESSNNTYSGGTTIAVGSTLRSAAASRMCWGPPDVGQRRRHGHPANNGSLDLDGFNPTIGGLGGGGMGDVRGNPNNEHSDG